MLQPQQDDCPLLRLPGDVLARIVCEAAASQAAVTAPPLCRGDLEADACAKELAGPPYINPERALRLQLSSVCRAFKRVLDEGVAWQRLFLDHKETTAESADATFFVLLLSSMFNDSARELLQLQFMQEEPAEAQVEGAAPAAAAAADMRIDPGMLKDSGLQLAWLAGLREETRRRVRAIRFVLPKWPSQSASALRALTADAALAAGLEELDLVAPGNLFFAPLKSLRLLASMRALRSLRFSVGSPMEPSEEDSGKAKTAVAAANDSIVAIASLPRLAELEIGGFSLSAATVRAVAASCPALTALRAEFSPSAPGDVRALLEAMGGLRRLRRLSANFSDDDAFDPLRADSAALRPLASLTELQSLHLELPVSSTEFVSKLPGLEHLSLSFGSDVDVRPLAAPALAGGLRTLQLNFGFEHEGDGRPGRLDEVVPLLTRLEALGLQAPEPYLEVLAGAPLAPLSRLRVLSLGWEPPAALFLRVATELTTLRELKLRGAALAPPSPPAAAALASRLARLVLETPRRKRLAPAALEAFKAALPGVPVEYTAV
eukprot:tig00001208_g7524.t1